VKRLVIPTALQVTALTLACSSTSTPPADSSITDARSDVSVTDTSNGDVADACVVLDSDPFIPSGFRCLPRRDAPAGTTCPTQRVCTAEACPTSCEGCESPLFCIPDMFPDGGRPSSCAPSETCSTDGCGAGCRAVG
jgi:hypothetical protein